MNNIHVGHREERTEIARNQSKVIPKGIDKHSDLKLKLHLKDKKGARGLYRKEASCWFYSLVLLLLNFIQRQLS